MDVAAEIAALCSFSAIKNNDRVGLVLATEAIEKLVPPKKGDKHVMRVIREILGHEPKYTGTNLKLALETLVKVAKRKSVAFVISDFFAAGFERVRMGFGKDGLQAMELTDGFGQTTYLRFSKLERNPQVNPNEFRFDPPKGADVLGDK